MSTIISRVGYCEKCAKLNKPKSGQVFLVMGGNSCCYKGLYSSKNGKAGFTPHLYKIFKVANNREKVYYQSLCCMADCGIKTSTVEGRLHISINHEKWSTVKVMSLKNWRALVLFKDTGLKI